MRILVIDADPGERLIVRSRMSDHGYEVVTAESGAKGLVEARATNFDVILLAADLGNGVDANEVCRRLKAIPRLNVVPIVMYATQASMIETADRAYDAGAEAFVGKAQIPTLDRVVRVMRQFKARLEEFAGHKRDLEIANRSLEEGRQNQADSENLISAEGQAALVAREIAAGRPDGTMIVDSQGRVEFVDRGACEMLGSRLEGRNLGSIAPNSGLEAFVRNARTELCDQFRFDVKMGRGRADRSLSATVVPVTSSSGMDLEDLRVVLLLDVGKRHIAEEILRTKEEGIPRHQLGTLLEAARVTYSPEAIVGGSEKVGSLRRAIVEASRRRNGALLLRGERGTGKEILARILHYSSMTSSNFMPLRCSALAPENLERELFGYVKGAFPGAIADRPGLLHIAHEGTLYLCEVGELPLTIQAKLLEFMRTSTSTRMGSTRKEHIELRIVASSSMDLERLSAEGRFLPELLRVLTPTTICTPPLREVLDDVPILVEHFIKRYGGRNDIRGVAEEAVAVMQRYGWPGNVVELEDCIEQACLRARGRAIELTDLSRPLRDLNAELVDPYQLIPIPAPTNSGAEGQGFMDYPSSMSSSFALQRKIRPWDITDEDPISLDLYEKKALMRALENCQGDKLAAARLLKVGKSTLYRKLKRLGIT